jgi:hypothetical protein
MVCLDTFAWRRNERFAKALFSVAEVPTVKDLLSFFRSGDSIISTQDANTLCTAVLLRLSFLAKIVWE